MNGFTNDLCFALKQLGRQLSQPKYKTTFRKSNFEV